MNEDPNLRLWSIQLSGEYKRNGKNPGGYRTNREVNVAAPDIVTAIKAAVAEIEERFEVIFVNSASHRGAVHLVTLVDKESG